MLHSTATRVGSDVPSGWELTGCVCHSRFTKTSNEKLIWQPFKGKSFPQVNYIGRGKKMNRIESLRHLCSVRARSVPREHHHLQTDGLHKLLSICFGSWCILSLLYISTISKCPRQCIESNLILLSYKFKAKTIDYLILFDNIWSVLVYEGKK